MREDIQNLKNEALAQIMDAVSHEEVDQLRITYLGRNGKVNEIFKGIKDVAENERREIGQLINEVKQAIEQEIEFRKANIKHKKTEWFDPSIPGLPYKIGHFHPTTIVIDEMVSIFQHLGFSLYEGPEIETDVWNFEKLNLPKDHPARSLQDALYIDEPEVVLRTHTSSVETRALATLKPPFRIIVAGKCYRFENVNASNNAMFYQFQGVALQKGISMADLKGTLYYFAKKIFGEDRKVRFRCKYYPEVEPGVGLDIDCAFCGGKGCTVCKGRGWMEMLGAGMIHPNILRNMGHDPKEISGFAFGMGLDRIVMDQFKINDIRSLYNGDIKY